MARRTRRDSRAAIFRAAAREFAERGYEAAGTDRIATRARVNKAMIYYHFGSKCQLYAEVVRDMVGAVRARVRAIADGTDPTPTFADGLQVQRVLAAVETSSDNDSWQEIPA